MSLLDTASLIVTPNGYKEGKLYSVIPSDGSGDLSVTRATTATRVNSAGLVELVPYNVVQYSQEYSNSSFWSYYVSSVTANSTTAPDGTLTADTLTISATNGSTYQSFAAQNAATFNLATYFKKTNEDVVYMDCSSSGGYFGASFNLTTQSITTFGGGFSPLIESVGNGWYRCSVNGFVSGSGAFGVGVYSTAGQSAYIWGTQLNEGGLKDYQKTETRLNIPRLDYSNGTCPSLLVEPQRTNLITYSSSFDNAAWITVNGGGTASSSVTANYGTAPDGTQTADRIQLNKGNTGYAEIYQLFSSTGGATYTQTMWLKSLSGNPKINFGFTGSTRGTITLSTEWQRYDFTYVSSGSPNGMALTLYNGFDSSTAQSIDVLAWGAQAELGSYSTSYIPTTSASVTRNADVISKTGISSLIGQTEGTLFWEVSKQLGENDVRLSISNSSTNDWIFVGIEFNNLPRIYCNVGGVNQFSIYGTQISNDFHKVAFAYKANDFALYIDGVQVITHTSGNVPTCSRLDVANIFPGADTYATSNNKAVALWKTRLTNTQLAQLTTI